MELIRQEVTGEPYVDIPGEVIDVYKLWRPTPLFRARRLEKLLNTPGPDLLQVRGRLPGRVAQAEHRGAAGVLQLGRGHQAAHHRDRAPGSGAARWRSRRAQYALDCEIWMVRASYDQKPHRRTMMQT